jgi:alanine dehydrogenase
MNIARQARASPIRPPRFGDARRSYSRSRNPGLILFTYLHLAAEGALTRELLKRRVDALGYETVQLEDGSLPLLAPMSEVAGRLAIQVGGWCLEAQNGGRGVLLSGAPGVRPGKVLIIGGGIAGFNASRVAAGVGAEVTILDVSPVRLRYLNELLNGQAVTLSRIVRRSKRSFELPTSWLEPCSCRARARRG